MVTARRDVTLGRADVFVLGTTKPRLLDAWNPTALDNVGAAFGWNGVTLDIVTGDYTIGAGATVTNKRFQGYVTFSAGSIAVNCVFEGRATGGAFSNGLVKGASGGTLDRCTIIGTTTSATYYMNGVSSTGGTWTLTRCAILNVVDSWHTSQGTFQLYGCKLGPYSFFDTDADQASNGTLPWWSHGDCGGQRLGGLVNNDEIVGCDIIGYFDRTDVTHDGTRYVNGAGTIGNPAAAMNGNGKNTAGTYLGDGSVTAYPNGNYANLITYSNTSPFSGMSIRENWLDGGSYSSGMIQLTTGTNHVIEIIGNRFGMGGMPGGGLSTIFFVTFPTSTTCTESGNVYDNIASVPSGLRGTPITWTSGGARVNGV